MILASILAAAAVAAAPETAPAAAPAAEAAPAAAAAPADAKPAMHRVCYNIEVSGSNLPKKKCVMEPVKDAKVAADAPAKKDAPKSE